MNYRHQLLHAICTKEQWKRYVDVYNRVYGLNEPFNDLEYLGMSRK